MHKRFWNEKKPLFQKRNEILKQIPNFWVIALGNHPTLGQILNKLDEGIFQACTSIESDESDPKRGFTLVFSFKPNQYFTNESLSVEVVMPEEIVEHDEQDADNGEDDPNEPTLMPSTVNWKSPVFAKDEESAFVSVFEAKEMPFICQMIHELVSDPVVAYKGEMGPDDDDEDEDDQDDEDDEDDDESEEDEEDAE